MRVHSWRQVIPYGGATCQRSHHSSQIRISKKRKDLEWRQKLARVSKRSMRASLKNIFSFWVLRIYLESSIRLINLGDLPLCIHWSNWGIERFFCWILRKRTSSPFNEGLMNPLKYFLGLIRVLWSTETKF